MTPETISPFDAAITELENRIQAMQITLETLKQLRSRPDGSGVSVSMMGSRGDSEVHHDSFFGMTIADAARKYLTMMKATKSTADVAAALEQGGLKHSSKDFPTTVRSVMGQRDEFTRVPNGDWGLTEWYPGQGRGRRAKEEKPKKKAKKKAKKHHGPVMQPEGAPATSAPSATASADSRKPGDRIKTYLANHPHAENPEIAAALGIKVQTIGLIRSSWRQQKQDAS